jgi:hypothetical protein
MMVGNGRMIEAGHQLGLQNCRRHGIASAHTPNCRDRVTNIRSD